MCVTVCVCKGECKWMRGCLGVGVYPVHQMKCMLCFHSTKASYIPFLLTRYLKQKHWIISYEHKTTLCSLHGVIYFTLMTANVIKNIFLVTLSLPITVDAFGFQTAHCYFPSWNLELIFALQCFFSVFIWHACHALCSPTEMQTKSTWGVSLVLERSVSFIDQQWDNRVMGLK